MLLEKPVDEITAFSKSVMTTMGEWELLDITYTHNPVTNDEKIDELAFHVSSRWRYLFGLKQIIYILQYHNTCN